MSEKKMLVVIYHLSLSVKWSQYQDNGAPVIYTGTISEQQQNSIHKDL